MKLLILIIEFLLIINIKKLISTTSALQIDNIRDIELERYGRNMSKYMDKRVNPCDDFYRYSCGNWHKYHKLSSGEDLLTAKDVLNQDNIKLLHQILNSAEAFPLEETSKLAKNYYISCMDFDVLENRGANPIIELLHRLHGMPAIHHDWKEGQFNFSETLINLKKHYNIDILIGLTFSNDYRDYKNRILYVGETPLSPIPRNYYFETKHKTKIENYRSMMLKFLQKLGVDYEQADALSKKFLSFERDILKGVLVDTATALKPMTIKLLAREHFTSSNHKFIDFQSYIQRVFGFTIPDTYEVIETNHHYIKSVLDVIQRTPNKILANYIMYKVAELFMYKNFNKNGKLIKNDKRITYCVEQTMKFFPKITTQLYYDKYRNLAQSSEINVRHYLRTILSLHAPSKKRSFDSIKIEFLKYDKRELEENQITGIEISDQKYYKNTENMMKFYANHWSNQFHLKYIEKNDIIKPLDINVYYISKPRDSIIEIPITAVQNPFYNSKYPKAINFARLGVYLARAFTNVYENFTQSKYAYEQDFLKEWWRQDDDFNLSNTFGGVADEKIQCFQNQIKYNQLAENIPEDESFAVSFGVKAAFLAYLDYLSHFKNDNRELEILQNETIFGLDLTNTQLFFIAYAQNFCRATKKKDDKLRILTSLANFDEFSEEFRCTEGSWMRPKRMCYGW